MNLSSTSGDVDPSRSISIRSMASVCREVRSKKFVGSANDCIDCDVCGKPGPSIRCRFCRTQWYCSEECQKAAWSTHKSTCRQIVKKMKQHRQKFHVARPVCDNELVSDTFSQECAICFADPIVDPIVLPNCKHAFCMECLHNFHNFCQNAKDGREANNLKCPCCRAVVPDIGGSLIDRSIQMTLRSGHYALTTKEKKLLVDTAMRDIERACIISHGKRRHQAFFYRGQLLYMQMGRPEEAIRTFYLLLTEIPKGDHDDIFVEIANAKMTMNDYRGASKIFSRQLSHVLRRIFPNVPRKLEVAMGFSKCLYHLKAYDGCIRAGEIALALGGRHEPGVHRYIALAQQAIGDDVAAWRTMTRAILYEDPFDPVLEKNLVRERDEMRLQVDTAQQTQC